MLGALTQRLGLVSRNTDVLLAAAVVGIVLLLVVPLPPMILDVLLSVSIILGVTTLLMTLYANDALEFNSFPSLLLFLTLFRLSLNIASTRMILSEGQAGDIIKTFGEFVTGGNQVVGLIIFILLTVVNFVVITKGSGRVAEVAARFTLDAMPGKQMSIDADLNAGIIDENEARTRREKINSEADFYGAMDGASKFVRGDAIAGIVITVVNIVGGFAIGVAIKAMSWGEAVERYMMLSVGDGLVSQIPALLVSVGAGIIVTRANTEDNLAVTLNRQLFNNPKVLMVTASIIGLLSLLPGMPRLVMIPIAAILGVYAYSLWGAEEERGGSGEGRALGLDAEVPEGMERGATEHDEVEKALFVDPMEIELGYGLIPLVDASQGGDLLNRITVIRRQIASELGIIVPPIRIRDNMMYEPDHYVVKIKGLEVAEGTLYADSFLAMNPGNVTRAVQGIDTTEPAFGLPAVWIAAAQRENAEMYGYTVVDALSVLATHLTEVIHLHAQELINRQEVSRLIENAKGYASAVIEELVPNLLTLGQVLKVLQNLLRERIPIRDFVTILEVLADQSIEQKDTSVLTEYVRQGLARTISKQYVSEDGKLYVITLDPKVEQMVMESVQKSEFGARVVLRPTTTQKIIERVHQGMELSTEKGVVAVVLTSPAIRPYFRELLARELPRLAVLSFNEVVADMEIESLDVVPSEVLM